MTDFWPIKIYIFGLYSSRAFQRCVTWCEMSPITEVRDEWFFQKKTSERVISGERKLKKCKKCREIVFFEVRLKRNRLVYIKI